MTEKIEDGFRFKKKVRSKMILAMKGDGQTIPYNQAHEIRYENRDYGTGDGFYYHMETSNATGKFEKMSAYQSMAGGGWLCPQMLEKHSRIAM